MIVGSKRRLIASLMLGAATLCATGYVAAQPVTEVGSVQAIEPDVTRRAGTSTQPAVLGVTDKVYMRDIVTTSDKGQIYVKFLDGSDLRLGTGSEVQIDEYVYNPSTGAQGAISVGRGVMRWVSGNVKTDGMKFSTPTATMGIRGTEILLAVYADGSMGLEVVHGIVTLVPCGRPKNTDPYIATQGQVLYVDINCAVSSSTASPSNAAASAPGSTASAAPSGPGPGGGPSGAGPGNGNGNVGNPGNGGGNTGGSGPGTGNGGNGNGNGGK